MEYVSRRSAAGTWTVPTTEMSFSLDKGSEIFPLFFFGFSMSLSPGLITTSGPIEVGFV